MLDPSSRNVRVIIEEIRITLRVPETFSHGNKDQVRLKQIVFSKKIPGKTKN